jgi:hypothetical protein
MKGFGFGLALWCAWVLGASTAWANDATFGGAGADLVPLERTDVEMKSEDITLEAVGVRWRVRARYVFSNHAAEAVKLQVGFPEYRCDSDQESDCGRTAFRDLRTKVEGAPVKHRSGTLDKKHEWAPYLGTVWLFDVTFPSGKDIMIEHEYSLDAGENVMGDIYTTYVTRTGASWRGGIGRARFTAILPPYTHTVKQPVIAGMTVTAPVLVPGPNAHVKLVLEARDWKPKGEVPISFNDDARYVEARLPSASKAWSQPVVPYDVLFRPELCMDMKDLTPEGAQDCRNVIYASKGFPFKKSDLVARFYSGSPTFHLVSSGEMGSYWVRNPSALPSFSESFLNRLDRQVLRDLERIAPAASGAPTPRVTPSALPSADTPRPRPRASASAATTAPVSARAPTAASSAAVAPSDAPALPSTSRCGCRVIGAPARPTGALLSLLVVAGSVVARRRASRSPTRGPGSRPRRGAPT